MLIQIVEDELALAQTIQLNLNLEGYKTLISKTGSQAIKEFEAQKHHINLVLLDVMLPEINGFDVCRQLKAINQKVPIIFLTAKAQSIDKIEGLKLGADDYITKPFELEELLLRINNLIKRSNPSVDQKIFEFENNSINFETFEIITPQQKLTLSKREIGLLKLLTNRCNKVVSREEIIDTLWTANENASSRTIDNFILNFRKIFEENPKEPKYFQSIRGVGYKFTRDNQ